jgi:hypothetical protein
MANQTPANATTKTTTTDPMEELRAIEARAAELRKQVGSTKDGANDVLAVLLFATDHIRDGVAASTGSKRVAGTKKSLENLSKKHNMAELTVKVQKYIESIIK